MRFPRRAFIRHLSSGCTAAGLGPSLALAAQLGGGHPLAPQPTHFKPQAKRLLFIFLTGGFSHIDTFDPKPKLVQDHGKTVTAPAETGKLQLMGSPFRFRKCGESGLSISELFPHLQSIADDLCVIRSMNSDIVEHFQATLAMHTGSATVPMPSIGAWLSYGLGTFNANLPSFVVLAEHTTYAGAQVWDNNFLPPYHRGVRIRPAVKPIENLESPARTGELRELELQMLRDVNQSHAAARPGDLNLRGRMSSTDIATGLMQEAPHAFDLSDETDRTLECYGCARGERKSFAWQCLMARRFLERGVRVLELIDTGSHDNWDSHTDIQDHRPKARRVDRPITALIRDLKQRGLFSDTVICICTEFGRTPWRDGEMSTGRNHHARCFTCLLTGAGIKTGMTYGATDEYGAEITENPCHVHDYHATLLHLLGIDHTNLTYRYGGRDFRLTDVAGNVVRDILA